MEAIQNGYRGLRLVVRLNLDWLVNLVTIVIALLTGAYVGSLF